MNLSDRANALWEAWLAQRQAEGHDDGLKGMQVVTDRIEELLAQEELEAAVEILMARPDALEQEAALQGLQQHVQHQAWTREVQEVKRHGRAGPLRAAHLVVMPIHGQVSGMHFDDALAQRLADAVNTAAVEEQGKRGKVDLLFLPFLVVPEACTMVVVDRWRKLMDEILDDKLLAQADMLKNLSDDFLRVHEADQARMEQAGVVTWGQRFALAMVVYDPHVWGGPGGMLGFLDDLQDSKAWEQAFLTERQAILPPMELVDALIQTLSTRLRLTTLTALADRQIEEVGAVAFDLPADDDLTQVMYPITPVVDGVAMEAIEVPANWLGMIGSEGMHEAFDDALTGLSEDVQALAPSGPEEDDLPVPLVPAKRPRLH